MSRRSSGLRLLRLLFARDPYVKSLTSFKIEYFALSVAAIDLAILTAHFQVSANQEDRAMRASISLRRFLIGLGAGGLMLAAVYVYERTPPNTFSPFCTYTFAYRLNVTIETGGRQYSSTAVRQKLTPRKWIATLGGCHETLGTALAFRIADNRLVLINTYLCQNAWEAFAGTHRNYIYDDFFDAMRERRKVDVASSCMGVSKDKPPKGSYYKVQGFVIDNADNPGRWRSLTFDLNDVAGDFRIVSAVAEAFDGKPEDQLATAAPAILKTSFEYQDWSNSPEAMIDFFRRYRPDKKFNYVAKEDRT
jgi:hypothetical protein